jgi:hypothetical protein
MYSRDTPTFQLGNSPRLFYITVGRPRYHSYLFKGNTKTFNAAA